MPCKLSALHAGGKPSEVPSFADPFVIGQNLGNHRRSWIQGCTNKLRKGYIRRIVPPSSLRTSNPSVRRSFAGAADRLVSASLQCISGGLATTCYM
jgi:hypothetical protein